MVESRISDESKQAAARSLDPIRIAAIIERYAKGDGRSLIHALQDIQASFGYIPCDVVKALCAHLDVPVSKAFSAATFYKAFSLDPKGDVIIRVCTGTACHIRGAQTLVDEISSSLGVKPGATTKDLAFTLETVNCVGACAMAPVVALNGKYHGNVQPGTIVKTIKGKKTHAHR